jgi:hypothetical protein
MKKLLFVMAFVFIGHQAFSQMYIVTISSYQVNGCDPGQHTLTTYPPTGGFTNTCISIYVPTGVVELNQTLNSIISQGYKLIETNNGDSDKNGTISSETLNPGTTYYFAIP